MNYSLASYVCYQVCPLFLMIDVVIETDKLLSLLSDRIQFCHNLLGRL